MPGSKSMALALSTSSKAAYHNQSETRRKCEVASVAGRATSSPRAAVIAAAAHLPDILLDAARAGEHAVPRNIDGRFSVKHIVLTVALLSGISTAGIASAAEMHKVIKSDAIQWGPAPPQLPKGAQVAVMTGDPGKAGLYIIRAKMPDGYVIPAHWHKRAENVTVISGTFNVGMGDKLDKSKTEALGPGGFFGAAPKMRHYAWISGETIIEVSGTGPFDITYVDPKDDPSKMAKAN